MGQFYRPGQTFHAKGLWLFAGPPDAAFPSPPTECASSLAVTYIGSSNLGERSAGRDLELGFVLWSDAPRVVRQLREEAAALESAAGGGPGGGEADGGRAEPLPAFLAARDPWHVRWLTRLLRTFL